MVPEGRSGATGESVSAPQVTDADRIAAVQAYIGALVSHEASAVPFAPDCTRVELGIKTGCSGAHLRRSLNGGQIHHIRASIRPFLHTD